MIKYFILLIILIINSCNYPDIDTVPDFNNNLNITMQESIDLCNMKNSENKEIDCYKELNEIIKGL